MEQWEDGEEKEVVVALQRRQPRRQSNTTTFTNNNGANANMDFKLTKSESSSEEEGEDKGRLEDSIFFDKDRGTVTITIGFSGIKNATVECSPSELNSRDQVFNIKMNNHDIGKILSTVINHQGENVKGEISHEEEDAQLGKGTSEDEESEEKVIEWEFERAVDKLDTHTMYSPNCNSCITKVRHPKPVDLFGCLGCLSFFSFFIPRGRGFNLFQIFGYGRMDKNTQISQQKPAATDNLSASDIAYEKGDMVIEQGSTGNVHRQHVNKNDIAAPDPSNRSLKVTMCNNGVEMLESPEHIGTPTVQGPVSPGHRITNVEKEPDEETMEGAALHTKPESTEIKVRKNVEAKKPEGQVKPGEFQSTPHIYITDHPAKPITVSERKGSKTFYTLKSIFYGGVVGSIASLCVVSSAAAADATTLNIVALALANLIGGLLTIGQDLMELKNDGPKERLGQRENFFHLATVAVLSFLVFGLTPSVTYSFSFWKSDNRGLKLVAVAGASLLCIDILAFGKAHMQRPPKINIHFKTVWYFVGNAILVSGVSYMIIALGG